MKIKGGICLAIGLLLSISVQCTASAEVPAACDVNYTISSPSPITISIACAGDPQGGQITFTSETQPSHGTLGEWNGENITYTPAPGYIGLDSFTYKVTSENGESLPATVNIKIGETYIVNTLDTNNDGTCDATHCSIYEAVAKANSDNKASYIGFSVDGTITLTSNLELKNENSTTIDGGAGHNVVLNGNRNFVGVWITNTSNNIIKGLVLNNGQYGVVIKGSGISSTDNANYNKVQNCYIGTDTTGKIKTGNFQDGIYIWHGSYNIIGTDGDGINDENEGNVISGNAVYGVKIWITSNYNKVAGNIIGMDVDRANKIANNTAGIIIQGNSSNRADFNIIGSNADGISDALERNYIAGNGIYQVRLSSSTVAKNKIAGNFIGFSNGGIGFGGTGIFLDTNLTGNNIIGIDDGDDTGANIYGDVPEQDMPTILNGQRNVIAGNGTNISFASTAPSDTVIKGNYIGVLVDGATTPSGSTQATGIALGSKNIVGTDADSRYDEYEGNVIGFNSTGILISSSDNKVAGNRIGIGPNGQNIRNNTGIKIDGSGATNNIVGGLLPVQANVITNTGPAGNATATGVYITATAGAGNQLLRNSVYGSQNPPDINAQYTLASPASSITAAQMSDGKIPIVITADASNKLVQVFSGRSGGAQTYLGDATYSNNNTYTLEINGFSNCETINALIINDITDRSTSSLVKTNYYAAPCDVEECGDGVKFGSEECDDGNNSNEDSCTSLCKIAKCGDGYVEIGKEACDDANELNTDDCLNDCTRPSCGDGFVWAGREECDDANLIDTDACLPECIAAKCGDGFVWAGYEQCDLGATNNSDLKPNTCRTDCKLPHMGDLVVDAGEQCDDGNTQSGDGCSSTGLIEVTVPDAVCGNGIIDDGEECDDGNTIDTDTCSNACKAVDNTSVEPGSGDTSGENSGGDSSGTAGGDTSEGNASGGGSDGDTSGDNPPNNGTVSEPAGTASSGGGCTLLPRK